tara:strand:- start:554 stop:1240 length:687 start_codon:yes stop_codon:yes gene_type:complete
MKYIIIPARGGSKGIQDKNIQEVGGIPLVSWSIIHAKYISTEEDKIIVSSDSEKILNLAKKYDVIGLKRPKYLSGDKVFTEPVMKHVLNKFNPDENDLVILLQPTSPLRKKITIDETLRAVESNEADSSLTLKKHHLFFWKKASRYVKPLYKNRPRRQDMESQLSETGSIYITKYKNFLKSGIRLSGNTKGIIAEPSESIDVDTYQDLQYVNLLSQDYLKEWEKELNI